MQSFGTVKRENQYQQFLMNDNVSSYKMALAFKMKLLYVRSLVKQGHFWLCGQGMQMECEDNRNWGELGFRVVFSAWILLPLYFNFLLMYSQEKQELQRRFCWFLFVLSVCEIKHMLPHDTVFAAIATILFYWSCPSVWAAFVCAPLFWPSADGFHMLGFRSWSRPSSLRLTTHSLQAATSVHTSIHRSRAWGAGCFWVITSSSLHITR